MTSPLYDRWMELCILGCGSSAGVPLVRHQWGACDASEPKNQRTRCGAMLRIQDQIWLIDVTPDFRQQALRENIDRIDGVMLTHAHFDHIGGLDDLKPFAVHQGNPIPVWMDQDTHDLISMRYPYVFVHEHSRAYQPFIQPKIIQGAFTVAGLDVIPFQQDHGFSQSLGFRFPTWAYSTDVLALSTYALAILQGVDLWFVDCMGMRPKKSHAHWDITMDWIATVRPNRAILIHMGIEMDYATLCQQLPCHIQPAYDGMCVDISGSLDSKS